MPTTKFFDLVRIYGFAHGTNVWTDNGEELIEIVTKFLFGTMVTNIRRIIWFTAVPSHIILTQFMAIIFFT